MQAVECLEIQEPLLMCGESFAVRPIPGGRTDYDSWRRVVDDGEVVEESVATQMGGFESHKFGGVH